MAVTVTLQADKTNGCPPEFDGDCWTAILEIDGSPHTDATGPSTLIALYSLATKLGEYVELIEAKGS